MLPSTEITRRLKARLGKDRKQFPPPGLISKHMLNITKRGMIKDDGKKRKTSGTERDEGRKFPSRPKKNGKTKGRRQRRTAPSLCWWQREETSGTNWKPTGPEEYESGQIRAVETLSRTNYSRLNNTKREWNRPDPRGRQNWIRRVHERWNNEGDASLRSDFQLS